MDDRDRPLSWTVVAAPAPIRALTVASSSVGLALVGWGEDPAAVGAAAERLGLAPVRAGAEVGEAAGQIAEYLAGNRRDFTLTIDWRLTAGTQRTVLQTLHGKVPFGRSVSYGELADLSGAYEGHGYTAARGVGSIMGSNPVPVVVPCHRVLASDGRRGYALGGFGGGLATKEWLLAHEGLLPPTLDLF